MRLGGGEGQGSGGRAALWSAPVLPARASSRAAEYRVGGFPFNAARPALRVRCSPSRRQPLGKLRGIGGRPPRARIGPGSPRRGPLVAQGRATADWRAPRGSKADVFNGSMLPAAGAAPGQAGPPTRPQPPRSHQLQLQLRALRLPASPAALAGNRRPGARARSSVLLSSGGTRAIVPASVDCSALPRTFRPRLCSVPLSSTTLAAAKLSRPLLAPSNDFVLPSFLCFSYKLGLLSLSCDPEHTCSPPPPDPPPHLCTFASLVALRWC